ncbi:hypothetical protein AB0B25_19610, partial [Nocardia sp. NPDC049190]|uniref:hypothetical protein n=1 Tax=Nocardia sp. NPDC049190 TaxID=3155650 RepID=UPI00340AD3D4
TKHPQKRGESEKSETRVRKPSKTIASKKLTKISDPPHGERKAGTKKFGTDIHRHTIEFSKNTRTHIQPRNNRTFNEATFQA